MDAAFDFAQLLSSSGSLLGAALRLAGVMLLAYVRAAAGVLSRVVLSPVTAAAAAAAAAACVNASKRMAVAAPGPKAKVT
jgi:hypothetical protein